MKKLLLLTFLILAYNSLKAQVIPCPEFEAFTELAFQMDNQDTIYYHEFNESLFDSVFISQFRNELDYLLINYSSFSNPSEGDTNISFQKSFQGTLEEPRLNDLLCQLYRAFIGTGKKRIITKERLMQISSQMFYSDSTEKRICLRVDGAYPLENPLVEAFCVSTVLQDLTTGEEPPSYYQAFLESKDMTSFQRKARTDKELENLLLTRYQTLKSKLTFELK